MPGRLNPLVTNEIYHVFNRGIDSRPTFLNKWGYRRAMDTFKFYQFISPPVRLSKFFTLSNERREQIMKNLLEMNETLVGFISFCLMPNHFHFLLKQSVDNGISKFMSNFQNSFTRYFNISQERIGPLFLDQFKAVRMETEEQLLHVSRYIHLNPYSSFVVKTLMDLENYEWSSFPEYLHEEENTCKKEIILSPFKNKEDYRSFVLDRGDYQRTLKRIKHLTFEG